MEPRVTAKAPAQTKLKERAKLRSWSIALVSVFLMAVSAVADRQG